MEALAFEATSCFEEYGSQLKYEYGAVAGPGDCNQEALLAEALGRPSPTKAPAPKPPMAARPQPEAVKPAPAPVQVVKERIPCDAHPRYPGMPDFRMILASVGRTRLLGAWK